MAQPISTLSQVAIGLEGTPGTPVKAGAILDAGSITLAGKGTPIRSRALTGTRQAKKVVMGAYQAEGDIVFDVTSDKCTKIFYATLSNLTTTGGADPYTQVFKSGNSLPSMTVLKKLPQTNGDMYIVYPGCVVKSLKLDAKIDAILEATVSLMSRAGEIVSMGNFAAAAGTVAATGTTVTGTLTTFTSDFSVGATIQIGGQWRTVTAIASDLSLTVNTGFLPAIAAGATAYKTIITGIQDPAAAASSENPFVFHQGVVALGSGGTAGAGTVAATGTTVTGTGTTFTNLFNVGDIITISGQARVIQTITSDTALVVTLPWNPAIAGGSSYMASKGNADTTNWVIEIDTGLTTPKGLGAGRVPNRAHPGDEIVKGSFDMVFDNITEHRRWMGILDTTGDLPPLNVGTSVATFPIQLNFIQVGTATARTLQIDIPSAYLTVSDEPITDRNHVITQKIQFEAINNANFASAIQITVQNGETNANITNAGATPLTA